MAKVLDTTAYLDEICNCLLRGEDNLPVPIRGISMRPFLRDGDTVYLAPIRGKIKPGDILLYQRSNGQYILHRAVKCREDGFTVQGDSQLYREEIARSQVRGIAAWARIGGRWVRPGSFRWWLFSHPWRWLAPVRPQLYKLWGLIKKK